MIENEWDGKERRQDRYHNILIRIDANLANFIDRFEKHEELDDQRFKDFEGRVRMVEKMGYGICGILIFVEIIAKILR